MGKITKIMLGLNIVAGIMGIVFGAGVKGELGKAKTQLADAGDALKDAVNKKTDATDKNTKDLKDKLSVVEGNLVSMSNKWVTATNDLATAQNLAKTADESVRLAEGNAAKAIADLEDFQNAADDDAKKLEELANYQALGTLGEIREWKNKAVKTRPTKPGGNGSGRPNPPRPTPNTGAEIGKIEVYQPKFGFYIINRGTDHGVKNDDEFKVVRAGNLVGKIKIVDAQPTVSVAEPIKELTRQQLQPGDTLRK